MEYIIYQKDNEDIYLESHTSTGSYTTTDNVENAETFASETSANTVIDILDGGDEFWGSKPKPH